MALQNTHSDNAGLTHQKVEPGDVLVTASERTKGQCEIQPARDNSGRYVLRVLLEGYSNHRMPRLLLSRDGFPVSFSDTLQAYEFARETGFSPDRISVSRPPGRWGEDPSHFGPKNQHK